MVLCAYSISGVIELRFRDVPMAWKSWVGRVMG
jgi:hypothetical protein